jgi:hypothetical protein
MSCRLHRRKSVFLVPLFILCGGSVLSQTPKVEILRHAKLAPSSGDVTLSQDPKSSGEDVTISAGKDGYPGVNLSPLSKPWDFSSYGHIEAQILNTGAKPLNVALRVDNAGNWQDNPWNTESAYLLPGQRATVSTIFGYSYGGKPGFALNPSKIVNLVIFTTKSDQAQSFRIESVVASGPAHESPPQKPEDVRIVPKQGDLFTPDNSGVAFEGSGIQISNRQATFSGAAEQVLKIRPIIGCWDLSSYTRIRLKVANRGTKPISPTARIISNGGSSLWHPVEAPIAPGKVGEIELDFAHPVDVGQMPIEGQITSDAVAAIEVGVSPAVPDRHIELMSAKVELPTAVLPDWLGKRPPVPGAWVKTLDDEFNGKKLDEKVWRSFGPNYYDKLSHWSKSNVRFEYGMAVLRYEKRTGFQNDSPKEASTPYASGYLDTYDLWTQRYGYFEARVKVPEAPGLWPAFWMMPDRGKVAGPEQWKRQDTANGGMEFDILEHLSRWGSHRFNIAMHYDGYEKDHKQIGSDKIYAEPDKDGFVTCGLLWEPGLVVYYYNGKEVLRWKNPRISSVPEILMFTMPMGGWDNNGLDDSKLPADFDIDYVRVWQRTVVK